MARERLPRATGVTRQTAAEAGVCVRPVALRRTDLLSGRVEVIDVPCGSTRTAVCPTCADRARRLRAQQCREGWHLDTEPDLTERPGSDQQRALVVERADLTVTRDELRAAGDDGTAAAVVEALDDIDAELAASGVRGSLEPDKPAPRRVRSTRRRQDAPDLPARPSNGSTLGRTFSDEVRRRVFRPSMFVTLTLPSYGRVRDDGTPVNPGGYDYGRAARDALHFGKLLDRFAQNLRRVAGYELQYFATVEPQRRLAPHAHFAIRGTLPRALVRQVIAATYHQVWWPATTETRFTDPGRLPEWIPDLGDGAGGYADPDTGEVLPSWDDALDHIGPHDQPAHVIRAGTQADITGVLAGTPEADRLIGYLVKYLIKDLGDDLGPNAADQLDDREQLDDDSDDEGDEPTARTRPKDRKAVESATRRTDHVARLVEALRWEPCSPTCANWLRYGVTPKNPRPGQRPGHCKSKAHKASHLGYAGRRVLVSRKWTGKNLTDHRADRKAHVLATLTATGAIPDTTDPGHAGGGLSATEPPEVEPFWAYEHARPTDPDVPPLQTRLLRSIAHHHRQRTAYQAARDQLSATAQRSATTEGDAA